MADALLHEELVSIHQACRSAGAPAIERPVPSVRDAMSQTPAWLVNFMDLAERLRGRSPIARQLPQTIDLAVFDALLGGDAWKAPAFGHLFAREHRQALGNAMDCLSKAVPELTKHLLPLKDLPFDRAATASLSQSKHQ